jgi:hypothetical protein
MSGKPLQLSFYNDNPFSVQLSFDHVIAEQQKLSESGAAGAAEATLLLQEIALHPELKHGITTQEQLEENADLISRLLKDYFPAVLTDNEIKGLSLPYRKVIFNHSRRFKKILAAAGKDFDINIRDLDDHQRYVLSCCLILNEFYGTSLDFGRPLFYDIPTAEGITKHYRILYNADFLEILPTERAIPLTKEDIDLLIDNYDNLELWQSKFPKESYILKGFAIMTLFDATVENAISIFKEKLLVLNAEGFQESIESIFRSIFRISDLQIGFTVFRQDEDIFSRANFGHRMKSFILPEGNDECGNEVLCSGSFRQLVQNKEYFTISDTQEFQLADPDSKLASHLIAKGIQSFILAPVVKDDVLMGVLEIVSPRPRELNSINANKLDVVMPFLTDSIDRLIVDIQNQLQAYIQDKYTTIHASVYWKFREQAEQALFVAKGTETAPLDEIVFPDVYPLYGQVDIKESSEARNSSIQKDLRNQMFSLLNLLKALEKQGHSIFKAEEEQLEEFVAALLLPLKANTEQLIINYVDNKLHQQLKNISDPVLQPSIKQYFVDTTKPEGQFHTYRNRYEATIAGINNKLSSIIDKRQIAAQALFPHYYERFKTDGVEHNLYIGASISPYHPFTLDKLYELRLWQLRVLCEMETAHHHLKHNLPFPLEVTTLILVYNTAIAIRFRMDEKRFDIDGTYNARFEIVKKRIDKAHIKGTLERITQPGKITVVYANDPEKEEYLGYFSILEAEGMADTSVEEFDVEDLQGVSGLKALRVKINHPL